MLLAGLRNGVDALRVFARAVPVALLGLVALGHSAGAFAGVLAEDRADALFHRYQGGGVTIQGPSVLVRKKLGETFAVNANY
jgi:hypothetical protein